MSILDLAGLLCWCLMSLAFLGTRSRVRRFNLICGLLLGVVVAVWLVGAGTPRGADAIALVIGLGLYWSGLLALRAMVSRSVSLQMLVCYSKGQDDPPFDDHLARRLDDARRYRLVSYNAGLYRLSRFGILLDVLLAGLYRVVGSR